jgi:hypothetical protein
MYVCKMYTKSSTLFLLLYPGTDRAFKRVPRQTKKTYICFIQCDTPKDVVKSCIWCNPRYDSPVDIQKISSKSNWKNKARNYRDGYNYEHWPYCICFTCRVKVQESCHGNHNGSNRIPGHSDNDHLLSRQPAKNANCSPFKITISMIVVL